MEGSKAFSKDFMARHDIPTAAYKTFTSAQFDEAVAYAKSCERVVLKASGLASGKGVLIPETWAETEQGLKDVLVDRVFGDAGAQAIRPPSDVLTCELTPRPPVHLCRRRGRH
jgi:phosphoribosylamine--glycine ligase/phosphoribosylformylglycinamidine cyclo-ligase